MVFSYYTRKRIIKNADIWFADNVSTKEYQADIAYFWGIKEDIILSKANVCLIKKQNSLISDLTLDEDELKKKVRSKGFKGDIKNSYQDNIIIKHYTSKEISEDLFNIFRDCYQKMFASKGMKTKLDTKRVKGYLEYGMLELSIVFFNNEPIVFHAYIVDNNNTRLLYSCSNFREETEIRKLIARANKRLHWEDITYFKKKGIKRYDWGGVFDFSGENSIDQFKMHFGGAPVTYYNFCIPKTITGKIVVLLRKTRLFVKGKTI